MRLASCICDVGLRYKVRVAFAQKGMCAKGVSLLLPAKLAFVQLYTNELEERSSTSLCGKHHIQPKQSETVYLGFYTIRQLHFETFSTSPWEFSPRDLAAAGGRITRCIVTTVSGVVGILKSLKSRVLLSTWPARISFMSAVDFGPSFVGSFDHSWMSFSLTASTLRAMLTGIGPISFPSCIRKRMLAQVSVAAIITRQAKTLEPARACLTAIKNHAERFDPAP